MILHRAVEPFVGFIDQLTNWYIRRNRPRFWSEEASRDRDEAFETLYTVLLTLDQNRSALCPFHQRCDLSATQIKECSCICPSLRFSAIYEKSAR